jgi:hypothetical protein
VAYILQVTDILIFLWKIYNKLPLSISNLFRQVFVICTFVYGIGVYIFSIAVLSDISESKFGICFYLMIISVVLLVAVVAYEQISRRKMINAELVKQLLEEQKQFDEQKQSEQENSDRYNMNKEEDSFVL